MTKSKSEATHFRQGSPNVRADPELMLAVKNIQDKRLRDVLSVSIKNVRTVHQLKKAIAARYNLSVQELLYRGTRVGDDRQLAYLLPTMLKIGNSPRFSVRTRRGTSSKAIGYVSFFVKSLQGKSFQVHLPFDSCVADVENAIRDHEGYSPKQDFVLVCSGKLLSTENISLPASGSVVHVVGRLPGGYANRGESQSFADMQNMSSLKTIKLYKRRRDTPERSDSLPWELVGQGLNIRGKCQNVDCSAYRCDVWCQKGFTVFNIAEPVQCPSCKKEFTAATCGFWKCEWMFEGRKGESGIDMMSKWNVTSAKEIQYFDDNNGKNTADWSSLVITAERLDGNAEHGSKISCALCFGATEAHAPPSATKSSATCIHAVHPECARNFVLAGYATCPMCRLPFPRG